MRSPLAKRKRNIQMRRGGAGICGELVVVRNRPEGRWMTRHHVRNVCQHLSHVHLSSLSSSSQHLEVLDMGIEGSREVGKNVVGDASSIAHLLDDGGDLGIVVLRHSGEEMVCDLEVEGTAEEGHESILVRIVDTCLDLRLGPCVGDDVAVLRSQGVVAVGADVRHLEVEGKPVSSHELSHKEKTGHPLPRHAEHDDRHDASIAEPDGLGDDELSPLECRDGVNTNGSIVQGTICLEEVLEPELDGKHTVQGGQVEMLVLVHVEVCLSLHQASSITLFDLWQIRVHLVDIGVDVMSDGVLIVP